MTIETPSPCKINLLLNILGRRPDGFHELETVMQPVPLFDQLRFTRAVQGIDLTCNNPALPTDAGNLVYRAAARFLEAAKIHQGVRIHLEKRIPLAAGLGGGSANAATTLLALEEMFDEPLGSDQLRQIAASLGSDVPFFLQDQPALATGRGEQIQPLDPFPALRGTGLLLIHPGFGVSTPWAYQQLARFPNAINGQPGRARRLVNLLQQPAFHPAAAEFYNSLEAPVLEKYPLLALFQDFLRANGAVVALMSGSGSTTFAIGQTLDATQVLAEKVKAEFGPSHWTAVVPL